MYKNYLLLDDTSCFAITPNFCRKLFFFVQFKCSATSVTAYLSGYTGIA